MQLRLTTNVSLENPVEGDLELVDAQIVLFGDRANADEFREAVAQDLRTRLKFFKGEWFLDQFEGVPYFENILVKAPDPAVIKSIFRDAILNTPHIVSVNNLVLLVDASTREASLEFVANTDDGSVIISADFKPFIVSLPT